MPLVNPFNQSPITLQLSRNLSRSIKRGHCWVYADSLRSLQEAQPGATAILLDNRGGREIGRGFYDPQAQISLRICTTKRGQRLNDTWAVAQMQRALDLRQSLFDSNTTAYRLFNGEGDGLPGLVCDRYQEAAVLTLDGLAARNFWHTPDIAAWLAEHLGLTRVYERLQDRNAPAGRALIGTVPQNPIPFMENGILFTAEIVHGQKTGFFLDQRENRQRMSSYFPGNRVLNVFGYTGGFSIYAGIYGASHVTTVDSAQPALDMAIAHWALNGLPPERHLALRAEAFSYLETAQRDSKTWECVILDPPSFAPSQETLPSAIKSYQKLAAAGAALTIDGGILAISSCSSHVSMDDFISACTEGVSLARRQATILGIYTQPADHPTPLAMPEFRYLKFVVLRINA